MTDSHNKKTRPRPPMDLLRAVFDAVSDFGVQELAAATATSPGVINNKITTTETSHHTPTMADLVLWPQVLRDDRIPQAYCRAVGGVFISLNNMAKQSDSALLDLFLRHQKELGDFAQAMSKALDEGRVTPPAYSVIRKEGLEAVAALMELVLRLEAMSHD